MKTNYKKTFNILGYLFYWLIFPPHYIWKLAKNKGLKKWQKITGYLLSIFSPFTLILFSLIGISIVIYKPARFSVFKIENTLGIEIPFWSRVNKNKITHYRQDFIAEVDLKFTERQIENLILQIKNTPFYNHQFQEYAEDENGQVIGDSLAYWTLRNYLEKSHMTGYWMTEDSVTFYFKEPNLSDIPNAAILFHESFGVSARLNKNQRILKYEYSKY